MTDLGKRSVIIIFLSLTLLAISTFGDIGRYNLKYFGPAAIEHSGISYRWITAHFTHLGWRHTWLNLAGLVSVWLVYSSQISNKLWLIFIVIGSFGISLGLHFLSPEVGYYVGLSGVLHGMLALAVSTALLNSARNKFLLNGNSIGWEDGIVFLGLWGKIAYEQGLGALPMTAAIAGDDVVTDAHLYGAFIGTVFALLILYDSRAASKYVKK